MKVPSEFTMRKPSSLLARVQPGGILQQMPVINICILGRYRSQQHYHNQHRIGTEYYTGTVYWFITGEKLINIQEYFFIREKVPIVVFQKVKKYHHKLIRIQGPFKSNQIKNHLFPV